MVASDVLASHEAQLGRASLLGKSPGAQPPAMQAANKRSRYNILLSAFGSTVLFSAYNTLQGYATSLLPSDLGNACLATIYGSVVLGIHFANPLMKQFGTRAALVLSACLYVVFMFSLLLRRLTAVILAASFLAGIGAAVFWVAVGAWLTQNSLGPHDYGRNTGLFWSIFQLCNVFGNIVAYLVFRGSNETVLFTVFGCVGVAGTALMCFLKPAPTLDMLGGSHTEEGSTGDRALTRRPRLSCRAGTVVLLAGAWVSAKQSMALLFTPRGLLFAPMFFFSGLELGFWSGTFPELLPVGVVGLVMAFAGAGEVVGGWVFGKLGDVTRSGSMAGGAVLYFVGLGLSVALRNAGGPATAPSPIIGGASLLAYLAAFCLGAGDASFNCNTYAGVSAAFNASTLQQEAAAAAASSGKSGASASTEAPATLSLAVASASAPLLAGSPSDDGDARSAPASAVDPNSSVPAFALFQLVQNLGSFVGFFYGIPAPLTGAGGTLLQVWVQVALGLLALATFAVLDLRYLRKQRV